MDYNNIFKVWGTRNRILLTDTSEIDLLYLKKDCFCSTHTHDNKINKFNVLAGKIMIQSDYGEVLLTKGMSFEVRPPLKHRFFAVEDSVMIECAYVESGRINADDINRISQGGRIIDGKDVTLIEMKEKGLLEL